MDEPSKYAGLLNSLPFVGLVAGKADVPMLTKIVENSIPGILAAALTLWASNTIQDSEIASLKGEVQRNEIRREQQAEKFDAKLEELRRDFYKIAGGKL